MDIEDDADVKSLIDSFYEKVTANDALGYIFTDVAKVDWEHHLPIMYGFWSSVIFGKPSYTGNPMNAHIQLNKLIPLTEKEFSEWLRLFTETVDEHFIGPNADEAKTRARNIAGLMLFKIQSSIAPE